MKFLSKNKKNKEKSRSIESSYPSCFFYLALYSLKISAIFIFFKQVSCSILYKCSSSKSISFFFLSLESIKTLLDHQKTMIPPLICFYTKLLHKLRGYQEIQPLELSLEAYCLIPKKRSCQDELRGQQKRSRLTIHCILHPRHNLLSIYGYICVCVENNRGRTPCFSCDQDNQKGRRSLLYCSI